MVMLYSAVAILKWVNSELLLPFLLRHDVSQAEQWEPVDVYVWREGGGQLGVCSGPYTPSSMKKKRKGRQTLFCSLFSSMWLILMCGSVGKGQKKKMEGEKKKNDMR